MTQDERPSADDARVLARAASLHLTHIRQDIQNLKSRHKDRPSDSSLAYIIAIHEQCLRAAVELYNSIAQGVEFEPEDLLLQDSLEGHFTSLGRDLGVFDNAIGRIDSAFRERVNHIGLAQNELNFTEILAVRSLLYSALLQYGEYCVTLNGLNEDFADFIPRSPDMPGDNDMGFGARARSVGETDAENLAIEISERELLEHPEVRQLKVLTEVARATAAMVSLEKRRTELVRQAREYGISWTRIGTAAEITPQAAMRKWDREARDKHRAYAKRNNGDSG